MELTCMCLSEALEGEIEAFGGDGLYLTLVDEGSNLSKRLSLRLDIPVVDYPI